MENTEFKKNHDGNGDIAKRQREMTNSALSDERELRRLIFLKFYFKVIAVSPIQFRDSSESDKQSEWLKSIPRFVGKI